MRRNRHRMGIGEFQNVYRWVNKCRLYYVEKR
jgi:hypothetical protein